METIYFLSGVGAVLLILSVVFVSGLAKRVSQLEMTLSEHENSIEDAFREISSRDIQTNQRIDREIDRTDKMGTELHRDLSKNIDEVNQTISNEVKEIYSTIDSRVDKLEAKLTSVDKDGCEPTKKILKG